MPNLIMEYVRENLALTKGRCKAQGHVLFVKAGTIVDGDFEEVPPDGTLAFDSTNNKLAVRDGGAWIYTAALT